MNRLPPPATGRNRPASSKNLPSEPTGPKHGVVRRDCGMGNIFRFVEPLILLDLAKNARASGYDILQHLEGHTLTGTVIDKAAVYRTLGVLETNGMTVSEWTDSARGAGRKAYRLTPSGLRHLKEWADLLQGISLDLRKFAKEVGQLG